jgi:hypothetical protein
VDYGDNDQLYTVSFYESPDLEYGDHQLDVTVDRHWSDLKVYIFDFLTVRVKNGDTQSDHFMIDESDPGVQYTGDWEKDSSAKYNYKGTTHKASSAGSTATFQFYGNTIEIFGAMRSSSNSSISIMSFQIDDGFKHTYESFNTEGKIRPNMRLFSRAGLPDGQHTLRIESLTTTEVWLDYFMYRASPTASSGLSSPSITSVPSPQPRKTQPAAIAGGILGGIAGLALIVALVLLLHRRRKPRVESVPKAEQGGSMGFETAAKVPYTVPFSSPDTRPTSRLSPHDQQRRDISGPSSSYESAPSSYDHSLPPPSLVAPIPRKYRNQRVEPVLVSGTEPSNYSAFTGSDVRDLRSPPPNYSNLSNQG